MNRVESRGEALRLQALGVIYVAVIAGLVWVSIASYDKVFTDHVTVSVDAAKAGSQLNVGGDVRMNGAIVGRVSKVESGPTGARIDLQIDSRDAAQIPTSTTARILPTTLFGQKFIELESTADVADGHLTDGSVLAEDASAQSAELTDVLDRLEPVLTAVKPDDLSRTLSALSTSLNGRGAKLGRLINSAGSYLGSINELTPGLEADLRDLGTVSGQYADVAPDLLDTADNLSTTLSTVSSRRGDLAAFFTQVTDLATSGERLLKVNRANLVDSTRLARPTLELLADYSPELQCVIQGFLTNADLATAQVVDGSIQGEFTVGTQSPGYTEGDALKLGDVGTGPSCRGLPSPQVPYPAVDLDDGVGDGASALMSLMLADGVTR